LIRYHEKVRDAIFERRLIKITYGDKELWFFRGKNHDYIIVPCVFCSCPDFQFNVLLRGTKQSCYHLLAQRLAVKRGAYVTLHIDCLEELNVIINEILHKNFSPHLRKLLFLRKL